MLPRLVPNSWSYRHEPPCPALHFLKMVAPVYLSLHASYMPFLWWVWHSSHRDVGSMFRLFESRQGLTLWLPQVLKFGNKWQNMGLWRLGHKHEATSIYFSFSLGMLTLRTQPSHCKETRPQKGLVRNSGWHPQLVPSHEQASAAVMILSEWSLRVRAPAFEFSSWYPWQRGSETGCPFYAWSEFLTMETVRDNSRCNARLYFKLPHFRVICYAAIVTRWDSEIL